MAKLRDFANVEHYAGDQKTDIDLITCPFSFHRMIVSVGEQAVFVLCPCGVRLSLRGDREETAAYLRIVLGGGGHGGNV